MEDGSLSCAETGSAGTAPGPSAPDLPLRWDEAARPSGGPAPEDAGCRCCWDPRERGQPRCQLSPRHRLGPLPPLCSPFPMWMTDEGLLCPPRAQGPITGGVCVILLRIIPESDPDKYGFIALKSVTTEPFRGISIIQSFSMFRKVSFLPSASCRCGQTLLIQTPSLPLFWLLPSGKCIGSSLLTSCCHLPDQPRGCGF